MTLSVGLIDAEFFVLDAVDHVVESWHLDTELDPGEPDGFLLGRASDFDLGMPDLDTICFGF